MNTASPHSLTAATRIRTPLRMSRLTLVIALTLGSANLLTQEAGQDEDAVELSRVAVTGSSIKRINTETASPLQIVSRQQIENMGAQGDAGVVQ